MRQLRNLLAATAMMAVPIAVSNAQNLTYVGPVANAGGGLGSVLTVLTLNNTDNISTGCISPSGTASCGFPDNTVQESSTLRFLTELGSGSGDLGTNLRIIGNFSEPGSNSATVEALSLRLYLSNALLGTWNLTGTPVVFANTESGVGNAGFGFALDATGITQFNSLVTANMASYADLTIGLGASLSDVQGGLETFSVARLNSSVVPEPSTYALMTAGLAALGFFARRRRRA